MKLYGETKVMVPWFDSDGMKQWQMLTFRADEGHGIDKRWLLRQIEAHIKKAFGKKMSHTWIKKNCPVINSEEALPGVSHDSAYEKYMDDFVARWVDRMQQEGEDAEDEDERDTAGETSVAGEEAAMEVCTVRDESQVNPAV